ncbi:MAG: zinc-binding dehydrogenase [Proteobacteria bacterium]|nr:zinc-binding dehydrogenase [Pseudomonadota bacterium]
MRSVTHATFGNPALVLTQTDQPLPQPGPGQVRIKTLLSPIHNHDLMTVRGIYGYKPVLPAIGGTEAVGLIDALGAGVAGLQVGQRVSAAGVHGTWAECFLAPAVGVVPVPADLSDEVAAQLLAMPLSALMLLEFLAVKPGDWLVQNAANGAVGKTLALLAAARGVHTINLVRRDAAVAELQALGIANVLSTAAAGWQERVLARAGTAPIRAAIDAIGGHASGELMALLGEGGLLVSFGAQSNEPMQISAGDLIFKQTAVKGFWGTKVSAATSAADTRRQISELVQRALDGTLKLPVAATFNLAEAAQAAAASAQTGRQGKVMLRP